MIHRFILLFHFNHTKLRSFASHFRHTLSSRPNSEHISLRKIMVNCYSHHGCLSSSETEFTKPPLTSSSFAVSPSPATIPTLAPATTTGSSFGAHSRAVGIPSSSSAWTAGPTDGTGVGVASVSIGESTSSGPSQG